MTCFPKSCGFSYIFGVFILTLLTISSTMAQTELYFAQAIRGNSQNTTDIFVQSSDSEDVDVTVEFYKADGTLDETQMTTLEPNGSDKITLGGPQVDPFSVGYAVVSADGDIAATAFYTLQVGSTSLPTIGVLPVTGSTTWRTFAKIAPGVVNSGIALAIPNAGAASAEAEPADGPSCQLTLYSGTDGTMAGSTSIEFGDDQQIARFITDQSWIPSVANGFEGPAVVTCDSPVVATALTQQASDNALATVAMEPTSGTTEVFFAQAIRGNALNTTDIFVQNSDGSDVTATVRFYKSDGTLEETQMTTLQPNGGDKITLGGPQVDPFSVGYAVVSATGNVVATAFYSLQVGMTTLPTIGVLPVTASKSWRTFAKIQPNVVNSGIAIAVPTSGLASADAQPAADPSCSLTLYNGTNGATAGSTDIDFGDDDQLARFITDQSWIPGVASGFEGAAVLICEDDVVATALTQQASDNALATVAMVQTDEEPGNGGGDPTTGTGYLPKFVTSLNLTSSRTLDQTLDLGVQIRGIISSGGVASAPAQFQLIQGVHAMCGERFYIGSIDFFGSYSVTVPQQTSCDVYVDYLDSSDFGGFSTGATPAVEASTIFVQEKMEPSVPVGDSDVIRNFSTSPLVLETVSGSVSNLNSLPPALLETDVIIAFGTTDDSIVGFTTLEDGGDSRNYMIDLPENRNYVASLQLFEEDQAMNFLQIVGIYELGSVNLAENSSPLSTGIADATANFTTPNTAELTGTVTETGESSVPDETFVTARDTRFTEFGSTLTGLAGGLSSGAVQSSGAYALTLVLNRQYDLFAGITVGEDGLWGKPDFLGSNIFSFNGPTTQNVNFPTRPMEVTLSGTVDGPIITTTAENQGVGSVSVSVTCRNLTGAPDTFFSGSTLTDSSGNYSLQVLSGANCEVEFRPILLSDFPFEQEPSEK